jgi:NADH:ubiquinone oxidoreductase subunit 2 (subunit N)
MNFNFLINNDLKYLIPEIFYFIVILLLLLFFVFYSNINIYKYTKIVKPLITLIIINFLIYIILILNSINYNNSISFYLLLNNNLTIFLKIFISFFSIFLLITSYNYLLSYNIILFEFYILIFISIFGMILIIMSYDFIITYLSIELQSLCFYILASINRNQNKSIEAGIKYFILGSFSSSLLLLGISIIYGITGISNFKDLSDILEVGLQSVFLDNFLMLGIILINLGIFFKLAIAPFHL